ncbi:hypothetical protein YDYSY3_23850 [Paenibacillus chitinolyticus]|nr:hypothetical protein YDYSY3_23850 [Paenibacillus chitinolyticus]
MFVSRSGSDRSVIPPAPRKLSVGGSVILRVRRRFAGEAAHTGLSGAQYLVPGAAR